MATATFSWTPTPGALSQTLEYSPSPYTTWSSPISLGGGVSSYAVTGLSAGTSYEFRIMATCSAGPSTWSVFGPTTSPCTAPASVKYKAKIMDAQHIANKSVCAVNNTAWGTSNGILFPEVLMSGGVSSGYAGVFHLDGSAVMSYPTIALTAAPLWKNFPVTTTNGRMNNQAISAGTTPEVVSGFIGFAYTYYATSNRLIYVGIGTNACAKIKLNGVDLLNQGVSSTDAGASWKIYPIYVNVGPNFFQFGVTKLPSTAVGPGNGASIGIEVYENTSAQIIAATTAADLNIIFSSASKVGTQFTVGDNFGYNCSLSDHYLDINVPLIGIYPQCVKII